MQMSSCSDQISEWERNVIKMTLMIERLLVPDMVVLLIF